MVAMSDAGYKLLGMLVWRAGRWYLRRRRPSTRTIAGSALGGLSLLVAFALIVRRAAA
jgi:hypothetical protein